MVNKRIKVTLSDDAAASIRRLSQVSGECMSSILSSLFETNLDHIDQISDLLEQSADIRSQLPNKGSKVLQSVFDHIQHEIQDTVPICDPENIVYNQNNEEILPIRSIGGRSSSDGHISNDSGNLGASCNAKPDLYTTKQGNHLTEPFPGFYDE
ncbi:hypothetical protein Ga0123461_1276 [Mariprofundus aestuarium]|uniref:Uncharacterized protein n=1 Tax=Mariprofundus aestuarium TaxID=1921086 RepID=A0A2K8L405_MARES|nr:hypothetical protein [Mariprofundus aestuarium]ATX79694.1 hypothetical protein Ga0123461_1276 [Mariprofundus aestuarium]